jgi:small-conductance mechanosensitive channel
MKHLQTILESNSLTHFLIAFGVGVITFAVLVGLRHFVSTKGRQIALRTTTYWDNLLVDAASSTKIFVLAILSTLLGLLTLSMSSEVQRFLIHTIIVVLLCQFGAFVSKNISSWLAHKTAGSVILEGDPGSHNYAIISFILRLVLWIVVVLLVLDNLGINITALVASLGIGGIAIALATQNILGDLFASLSIALDKPFLVGDTIVVDNLSGTVRHIGLKTTRITSSSGEELVVSNADLLKSRIRNYRKMEARRAVFTLSIALETPPEKLKKIPDIIREILDPIDMVRLNHVYFSKIGLFCLDFEVSYFVNVADYAVYIRAQETLNLAVMERFAREDIRFAVLPPPLHINNSK